MSALAEALLAVLLQRPVYKDDRAPELAEAKRAQLSLVAGAVAEAAAPPAGIVRNDWAALLLTIGEEETHWSLRIGRGECKRYECDPRYARGVLVEHRARGYWQPHRNKHNEAFWDELHGEGSELTQAKNANAMLTRGYWTCARSGVPWLQAAINGYAGKRCSSNWKGLGQRLKTWKQIRQKLP